MEAVISLLVEQVIRKAGGHLASHSGTLPVSVEDESDSQTLSVRPNLPSAGHYDDIWPGPCEESWEMGHSVSPQNNWGSEHSSQDPDMAP